MFFDLASFLWQTIKVWYWVLLPFIFWPFFIWAWLWWRRELWQEKQKYILLELTPPAENIQQFSAMEQVFSNIWGVHTSIEGFRYLFRKWWEGRRLSYFSLEIESVGDKPRLFIRCSLGDKDTITAALWAQYPNLEITEAKDYTNNVPKDIPNKDWDLYGMDMLLYKEDVYPIKTYSQFFEQKPESVKEEKRIDPLNVLFEGMAQLKPDEQIWVQFRVAPTTYDDNNFKDRGLRIVEKLAHRKEEAKEKEKKGGFVPPEMKLTPEERDVVNAIEAKIGKQNFEVNIRCLYIAKREVFNRGRKGLVEQFFTGFSAKNLNGFKKHKRTKTTTYFYHLMGKSFSYLKKRQIFRRYILRETPIYPLSGGTFILNTEELATLFHPPLSMRSLGSGLARIESKKAEPPSNLPVE